MFNPIQGTAYYYNSFAAYYYGKAYLGYPAYANLCQI